MYQSEQTVLARKPIAQIHPLCQEDNDPLSYGDFLSLLQTDKKFRSFFISLLNEVPFRAYHWETPAVSTSNTDQPFAFVVTKSPGIDLAPNAGPFKQYFSALGQNESIAVFENLGRDALLIAPTPRQPSINYSHIGVFTEQAPQQQQHELWKKVGAVTKEQLTTKPLWLNTAGGGVAWLHMRLDSRPKYYNHHPYRSS
ncbi:MAG: hypothetical protein U5J63_02945 [Fodinibius sp.]|nr:hypothetical protein [Fodinibius sp.]